MYSERKFSKSGFRRFSFFHPICKNISALSSGKVLIDIDSRFTKGLAVSLEQPLHATVWANIDKSYQKKLREDNLSTCTSEPCSIPKNLFQ